MGMAILMTTSPRVPELCAGDVLTRAEFERRYRSMPHLKKAELIEGVVYMGSPVRYLHHGRPDRLLSAWLSFYEERTPGLDSGANSTLRLDLDNEVQPDLLLRLPERAGGHSRIAAEDYLEGAPELVIEVAASSVSYDLHQKLAVYRRSGVPEYLVLRVDDAAVDWFELVDGRYERLAPDPNGVLHSRVFPGLALSVQALLAGDLAALRRGIDRAIDADRRAREALCARLHGP